MITSRYQQLAPLRPEEREALKADIAKRGVLVPVEVDEDGNILDGFHRTEIAQELGIEAPTIVRSGWSEEAKVEHAIKINMLRRHLSAVAWGDAFQRLLSHRGVETGQGARNDKRTSDTVSEVAKELGVNERTARRRVKAAEELNQHPDLFEKADTGEMTVKEAVQEKRKRERAARPKPELPKEIPMIPAQIEVANAISLPLPDECVDLIVTSPPYGLDKPYAGSSDPAEDWCEFMTDWLIEAYRVTRPRGRLALNVPLDVSEPSKRPTYSQAVSAAQAVGWDYAFTIVWNEGNVSRSTARGSIDSPSAPNVIAPVEMIAVFSKGGWIRGGGGSTDLQHDEWLEWTKGLWEFSGESRPYRGHPAAFPPELPRRLIKLLSYVFDTVLDPFSGSGTTPMVAVQLGRNAIAFDISEQYVKEGRQRIAEVINGAPADR